MINIIPVLILNTLAPNTESNGYSYRTSYELTFNVNYLNISNGTSPNFDFYCNEGKIWLEGYAYINNERSYRFSVDDFGFTMRYYHNSTDLGYFTSASTNQTYDFYFDERDDNLSFRTAVAYNGLLSSCVANAMILNTGGNSIYCEQVIDTDYFYNYVDDLNGGIYGQFISNDWNIDFRSDSTVVDYFERQIQAAVRASDIASGQAYDMGYTSGYNEGRDSGYREGYANGAGEGHYEGYNEGYAQGLADGTQTDETAAAIYAGIIATGMIPIQFFLSIFNFEIFGINLTGFVTSLMSVCIVLIVIKRTFAVHEDS